VRSRSSARYGLQAWLGLAGMVDGDRWARYLEAAVERAAEGPGRGQEGAERLRRALLRVGDRIDGLLASLGEGAS